MGKNEFVSERHTTSGNKRSNKAFVEEELYKSAFGIISNVLQLVGTDYVRHTDLAFKYIARPYNGKLRARVIIMENDSNMSGTYQHLVNERERILKTDPRHKNVKIINDDIMGCSSYRFEDLDFCGNPTTDGRLILERFKDQITTYQNPKYRKAMIFTISERGASRKKVFKFLQDMLSCVGAELIGMNSEEGAWLTKSQSIQKGKPYGKSVHTTEGKLRYKSPIRAYEARPMFKTKGNKLRDFKVFNYRDSNHIDNGTACMVTGIIVYR